MERYEAASHINALDRLNEALAEALRALAASDNVIQTMAALPLNMHVSAGDVKTRVAAALALNRRLSERAEALARSVQREENLTRASRT